MKTRRDFIKISALGIGATAIAGGTARLAFGSSLFGGNSSEEEVLHQMPTYCEVCFWKLPDEQQFCSPAQNYIPKLFP